MVSIRSRLDTWCKELSTDDDEEDQTKLIKILSEEDSIDQFLDWVSSFIFPTIGKRHHQSLRIMSIFAKSLPDLQDLSSWFYVKTVCVLMDWILLQLTQQPSYEDSELFNRLMALFSNKIYLVKESHLICLSDQFMKLFKFDTFLPDSIISFMEMWLMRLSTSLHESAKSNWSIEFSATILEYKWCPKNVLSLTSALKEFIWSPKIGLKLIEKILSYLVLIDWDNWPPLVYQLLLLTKKNNIIFLIQSLDSHFSTLSELEQGGEMIVDHSNAVGEIKRLSSTKEKEKPHRFADMSDPFHRHKVEASVLVHINFACQQNKNIQLNILKLMKLSRGSFLTPFFLSLALSLIKFQEFENKITEFLKLCVQDLCYASVKLMRYFNLEQNLSKPEHLTELSMQILQRISEGWENLLEGALCYSFLLLDVSENNENLSDLPWKAGSLLLEGLYKSYESTRAKIIDRLIHILSKKKNDAAAYVNLFHMIVQKSPFESVLLKKCRHVVDRVNLLTSSNTLIEAIFPILLLHDEFSRAASFLFKKYIYLMPGSGLSIFRFEYLNEILSANDILFNIINSDAVQIFSDDSLFSSENHLRPTALIIHFFERGYIDQMQLSLLVHPSKLGDLIYDCCEIKPTVEVKDPLKALELYAKGDMSLGLSDNVNLDLVQALAFCIDKKQCKIIIPLPDLLLCQYCSKCYDKIFESWLKMLIQSILVAQVDQLLDWKILFGNEENIEDLKFCWLTLLVNLIESILYICLDGKSNPVLSNQLWSLIEIFNSILSHKIYQLLDISIQKKLIRRSSLLFNKTNDIWKFIMQSSGKWPIVQSYFTLSLNSKLTVCRSLTPLNSIEGEKEIVTALINETFIPILSLNLKDWSNEKTVDPRKICFLSAFEFYLSIVNGVQAYFVSYVDNIMIHLPENQTANYYIFHATLLSKLIDFCAYEEASVLLKIWRICFRKNALSSGSNHFLIDVDSPILRLLPSVTNISLFKIFGETIVECSVVNFSLDFSLSMAKEFRQIVGSFCDDTERTGVSSDVFHRSVVLSWATVGQALRFISDDLISKLNYLSSIQHLARHHLELHCSKSVSPSTIDSRTLDHQSIYLEMECKICNRLIKAIIILNEFVRVSLKGNQSEVFYKMLVPFYKCFSQIAKARMNLCPHLPLSESIIHLVAQTGTFTKCLYNFIAWQQSFDLDSFKAAQSEDGGMKKRKRNSLNNSYGWKSRILKESRLIPSVIYEIELSEQYYFKLANSSKTPLWEYFSRSTSRDFRIKVDEIFPQNDDHKQGAIVKEETDNHGEKMAIANEVVGVIDNYESYDESEGHTSRYDGKNDEDGSSDSLDLEVNNISFNDSSETESEK